MCLLAMAGLSLLAVLAGGALRRARGGVGAAGRSVEGPASPMAVGRSAGPQEKGALAKHPGWVWLAAALVLITLVPMKFNALCKGRRIDVGSQLHWWYQNATT